MQIAPLRRPFNYMGAGEEDQDRQNTESESSNVIEVAVFLLQKLRQIGRLWTDLATILGDLFP